MSSWSRSAYAESAVLLIVSALAACLWPSDGGVTRTGPGGGGTPATVAVRDSTISPSQSVITIADSTLQAGSPTRVTLRLRDSTGHDLPISGRTVQFILEGGSSTGTFGRTLDGYDGSYETSFTGALAGSPSTVVAVVTDTTRTLDRKQARSTAVWSTKPTIRVFPGPLSSVKSELRIAEPDLWVGDTTTVRLVARDDAGNLLTHLSVEFAFVVTQTPGSIGPVAEGQPGVYTATFTASRAGSATIATKVNGQDSYLPGHLLLVSLDPANPPGLTITPRGASIAGGTTRFSATLRDSSGAVLPVGDVRWASLNPYVGTMNETSGEFTAAVPTGQVIVSATANGATAYAVVNVAPTSGNQASRWSGFSPPWEIPFCDGGNPYLWCPKVGALWGTSPSDVYAGGSTGGSSDVRYHGMIYHFDGNAWQRQLALGGSISAFWGSSANDVYASTGVGTFHYDGASWSSMETQPASITWGAAPNDIYGSGGGHAWHYDGRQWSVSSAHNLSSIWGLSAVDIYATEGGVPYHYDGHRWSIMPNSTGVSCTAFWGTSPSNLYCVSQRQVWRFNGATWTPLNPPVTIGSFYGTSLGRIWGTSATDIYVVGAYAELFGFDGSSWHVYHSHFDSDEYDLNNVWAIGNTVFTVGDISYGYRGTP